MKTIHPANVYTRFEILIKQLSCEKSYDEKIIHYLKFYAILGKHFPKIYQILHQPKMLYLFQKRLMLKIRSSLCKAVFDDLKFLTPLLLE